MDEPTDKPPTPDWKKESWASREAKRKEKLIPKPSWDWEAARDAYKTDPKGHIAGGQQWLDDQHAEILEGLRSGNITEAKNWGDPKNLNDPYKAMQETIDRMAHASGEFKEPPRLLIQNRPVQRNNVGKPIPTVSVRSQEFIEIDLYAIDHFLAHPDAFKVAMAHEMGHIVNGDMRAESMAIASTMLPNQKTEILADRMGALIHGNPREYAKINSNWLCCING